MLPLPLSGPGLGLCQRPRGAANGASVGVAGPSWPGRHSPQSLAPRAEPQCRHRIAIGLALTGQPSRARRTGRSFGTVPSPNGERHLQINNKRMKECEPNVLLGCLKAYLAGRTAVAGRRPLVPVR